MAKKILAIYLDADDCTLEPGKSIRELLEDPNGMYQHIYNQIQQAIRENPDVEIVLGSGSNRIAVSKDCENAERNGTVLFFDFMKAMQEKLSAEFPNKVQADNSLLSDGRNHQCSDKTEWELHQQYRQSTPVDLDENPQDEPYRAKLTEYAETLKDHRRQTPTDGTKITDIYRKAHRLAAQSLNSEVKLVFYDDREDILSSIKDFFDNNRELLPINVTLDLRQRETTHKKESEAQKITIERESFKKNIQSFLDEKKESEITDKEDFLRKALDAYDQKDSNSLQKLFEDYKVNPQSSNPLSRAFIVITELEKTTKTFSDVTLKGSGATDFNHEQSSLDFIYYAGLHRMDGAINEGCLNRVYDEKLMAMEANLKTTDIRRLEQNFVDVKDFHQQHSQKHFANELGGYIENRASNTQSHFGGRSGLQTLAKRTFDFGGKHSRKVKLSAACKLQSLLEGRAFTGFSSAEKKALKEGRLSKIYNQLSTEVKTFVTTSNEKNVYTGVNEVAIAEKAQVLRQQAELHIYQQIRKADPRDNYRFISKGKSGRQKTEKVGAADKLKSLLQAIESSEATNIVTLDENELKALENGYLKQIARQVEKACPDIYGKYIEASREENTTRFSYKPPSASAAP